MSIDTNIALTSNEVVYYKKFEKLSVNEEPLLQGDGVIRISPFDDYVMFTIFSDNDNEDIPIDLSNVGTVYLSFIGESDEIKIPNYTNVQDIDSANGQVVFRISAENSKRILSLDNNNFYISSVMIDGDDESDESIIYSGKFYDYVDANQKSLTKQLEDLRIEYSKILAEKEDEITSLNNRIEKLNQIILDQGTALRSLRLSNQNLLNEIENLSDELAQEAEDAQNEAESVENETNETGINTDPNNQNNNYWENEAGNLETDAINYSGRTYGGPNDLS